MRYLLAIFKSRNETLYFSNLLKTNGIYSFIINTPKEAGQTCGISVKYNLQDHSKARMLLQSKPFKSFYGFYLITEEGFGRRSIERYSWNVFLRIFEIE